MTGEGTSVKVRGIYSTALAKLLLDHGFTVVAPSIDTQERLGLEPCEGEPDVFLYDRQDKHGVVLKGERPHVGGVRGVIAEDLEESVFFSRSDRVTEVVFPLSMKRRLDSHRAEAVPTLKDHHYYRAFGVEVAAALDMAERLLGKGSPREEVEEKFLGVVAPYMPYEGLSIGVDHVKLSGVVVDLGLAEVQVFQGDVLVYERVIRGDGSYDGLGVGKEAGDVARSRVSLSEYWMETRYFSRRGKLLGTYFNINTPVEVYSSRIRYIDLEIDVVEWPDGRREIIDVKDLDRAESLGTVTPALAEKARRVAEDLWSHPR